MSTVTPAAAAARQELPGFDGRLIGPEDVDYDQARKVYNALIDKRPAVIARCASLTDVQRTVAFARDHDLLLAIRGGGHNGAGLGTCWGEEKALEMLHAAGFRNVHLHKLPHDIMNSYYVARKR